MNSKTIKRGPGTEEADSPQPGKGSGAENSLGHCPISRRSFCNELLLGSSVLIVGSTFVASSNAQERALAYPPVKIEGAERLIVDSSLYFEYPTRNDPAVLLRSAAGEYYAFSRKCSHAGCSVEFDGARKILKCPCHKGAFDPRIGNVMYGPAQRPLDQIVLQLRAGGEVWAVGKSKGSYVERFAQNLQPQTVLPRSNQ